MQLNVRNSPYIIPRYSLTGDVLSFQRCGRQYRFYNGSSLPPSRPVQFWTGEFVHGCMEDAFSLWTTYQNDPNYAFPWPMNMTPYLSQESMSDRKENDIGVIGDRVEARLLSMQKSPRSRVAREAAYARVDASINLLGPDLFPIITSVEQKISGSRDLLSRVERSDKYELFGIADVISHIEMEEHPNNRIINMISNKIPRQNSAFDIIVDYKAARRPRLDQMLNNHHMWQIQTYSWLRNHNAGQIPIKAGIIIYIDELSPTKTDLLKLKHEIEKGTTDIIPERGSADYYRLYRWNEGDPIPQFSSDFLIRRALRIISTSDKDMEIAVREIDNVVQKIEEQVQAEYRSGSILDNWQPSDDVSDQDCITCDFRRFCHRNNTSDWAVQAPG